MKLCRTAAVWDTDGAFLDLLRKTLPHLPLCRMGAGLSDRVHLLALAPDAAPPPVLPACQVLLLPGHLAPLAGQIRADWVVSYGLSPKNTLTLSAWSPTTASLTLQRELVTLTGTTLPPQDFVIPHKALPPLTLLGLLGVKLTWG